MNDDLVSVFQKLPPTIGSQNDVSRILVVEDDQVVLQTVLKRLLRKGYLAEGAQSGKELMTLVREYPFDLLLLDYQLPDMTSQLAIEKLSRRGINIPFIIMTGYGDESIAVEMMKLGAQDYLIKDPRLYDLLPKIIEKAISRITDKKRLLVADEKIREQASLLDHAEDAIMVENIKGEIQYWNRSASRIYGFDEEEAIGKTAAELLYDKADNTPENEIKRNLIDNEKWSGNLEQFTKSGSKRFISSKKTLVRDREGAPKSVLVINTDITEKVELENKIIQSQKMETIGQMAGGIAHDFNNILASIFGYSQLAIRSLPEDSKALKDIEQVLEGARQAKSLVEQILLFSKHSSLDLQPCIIHDQILDSVNILKGLCPSNIEIITNILADRMPVIANLPQINQILMNLGMNAIHSMDENSSGKLTIQLEDHFAQNKNSEKHPTLPEDRYQLLTVTDTGKGMDDETLKKIFEPFFTTKSFGKGTGLGLAVVHGITNSYNGDIRVRSSIGEGTTFSIYIPVPSIKEEKTSSFEIEPSVSTYDARLLLVDDDNSVLTPTKELLTNYGYSVSSSLSSALALQLFRSDPSQFDLIITDEKMPEITGSQLVKEIRSLREDIPIIITTGFTTALTQEKIAELNIRKIIKKPYSIEDLRQSIQRILTT